MFNYEIHFTGFDKRSYKDCDGDERDAYEDILSVFDDFSWGMGLAVEDAEASEINGGVKVVFTSTKDFVLDDNSGDIELELSSENIYDVLTDKEQFFCSVWSMFIDSDITPEELNVLFVDNNQKQWKVSLGKYAELTEIQ